MIYDVFKIWSGAYFYVPRSEGVTTEYVNADRMPYIIRAFVREKLPC